jgi:hypothetical protein
MLFGAGWKCKRFDPVVEGQVRSGLLTSVYEQQPLSAIASHHHRRGSAPPRHKRTLASDLHRWPAEEKICQEYCRGR